MSSLSTLPNRGRMTLPCLHETAFVVQGHRDAHRHGAAREPGEAAKKPSDSLVIQVCSMNMPEAFSEKKVRG